MESAVITLPISIHSNIFISLGKKGCVNKKNPNSSKVNTYEATGIRGKTFFYFLFSLFHAVSSSFSFSSRNPKKVSPKRKEKGERRDKKGSGWEV